MLAVGQGEIRGLIGPNGSGKTTTVNLLSGLYRADAGEISLRGERIERLRPHEIAARGVGRTFQVPKLFGNMTVLHGLAPHAIKRRGIGYVTQGANIFPQLTVDENLRLGAWVLKRDRRRVGHLLERAWAAFPHLAARRRLRATTLSGGEAKMLSLAKEAMTEPVLLLVDEPSAGLAPRITDQIYARLLDARARGLTVLLVDQNIAKARSCTAPITELWNWPMTATARSWLASLRNPATPFSGVPESSSITASNARAPTSRKHRVMCNPPIIVCPLAPDPAHGGPVVAVP